MKKIISAFILILSTNVFSSTAIINSGGVSLGSYKAGFLYYVTEFAKLNPNKINLSHFTGASAGGINSLLALDSVCSEASISIEDSLFWNTWIPTGMNQLYDRQKVTPLNLFHRDGWNAILQKLKENLKRGYNKNCKKIFAIPLTQTRTFNSIPHKRVYTPGLRNFIIVEIIGNDQGQPVTFKNVILDEKTYNQLQLPFSNDFEENFELIKNSLFATSAFPLAFKPVPLSVCAKTIKNCNLANSQKLQFIDGGFFDNAPLGLAFEIFNHKKKYEKDYSKGEYLYVDTSNHAFKTLGESGNESDGPKTLSPTLFRYLNNIIEVARNSEEAELLRSNIEIVDNIKSADTILPPTSSPLYAFLGFYDKSFREFDFHLGLNDAKSLIQRNNNLVNAKYPDINKLYPIQDCMSMVRYPNEQNFKEMCLKNIHKVDRKIQILFQLALDRSFNFCKNLTDSQVNFKVQCLFQNNLKSPFSILTDHNNQIFKYKDDENKPNLIFDFLDAHHFDYTDLNVKYSHLKNGKYKLYESQRDMLDELRRSQPFEESAIIGLIESYTLKLIDYIPPKSSIYLNIGTSLETGYSVNFFNISRSLNFQYSVYVHDIETILGTSENNIAFIPNAGLTFSPNLFYFPAYNISFNLGAHLAQQFSMKDRFTNSECNSNDYKKSPTLCSAKAMIFSTNVSFFDRLNLKIGVNVYEKKNLEYNPRLGFIMVGYQFF